MKKLTHILDCIYAWGIFLCLFVGGAMFFGYLAAMVLGGEPAVILCDVIRNRIFPVLIYAGNLTVLLGLLSMYLKKQKSLAPEGKK